jgi:hypothetical protein
MLFGQPCLKRPNIRRARLSSGGGGGGGNSQRFSKHSCSRTREVQVRIFLTGEDEYSRYNYQRYNNRDHTSNCNHNQEAAVIVIIVIIATLTAVTINEWYQNLLIDKQL